jgi:hypothetical protein
MTSDPLRATLKPLLAAVKAAKLPEVEQSEWYGTPAIKVGTKSLARVKEPGVLVLRCPLEEKEMLMEAAPDIYFETDHYKGWPAVLIRVAKISTAELATRAERAWRMQAPQKLIAAFDARTQPQRPKASKPKRAKKAVKRVPKKAKR